jgi:16S rRNA (adenine1518-N6/adenine1519-N6)-dimethyltransferase
MDESLPVKKSLGQHWLGDAGALRAMVEAAEVGEDELVLEIGPGQGALTAELAKREAHIHAIEYDESLIPALQKRFENLPSTRFYVEHGDIRTFDFGNLAGLPYKIVANIPYYLTANLMRRLTDPATPKPNVAALLMQQEVAERIAARPGQMAFLSVVAQFYYQVSLGRVVRAELFSPPPKVDSQILILKLRSQPLFPDVDPKQFFGLAKAGFVQRRKTMLNSLGSSSRLDRAATEQWLQAADIAPNTRAQTLSLDDWYRLYQSKS